MLFQVFISSAIAAVQSVTALTLSVSNCSYYRNKWVLYASAHQSVQENTAQADKEFLLLLVTASQCVLQYTGF